MHAKAGGQVSPRLTACRCLYANSAKTGKVGEQVCESARAGFRAGSTPSGAD